MVLNPEKRPDHGRYDHQENAGPEPGGSPSLSLVPVSFMKGMVDPYGPDKAEKRADAIHELDSGIEIPADHLIGLVDTLRTVLSPENPRDKKKSQNQTGFEF